MNAEARRGRGRVPAAFQFEWFDGEFLDERQPMSWEFEIVDGPYDGTTEGPVWDGSGLLFTHIPTSRIMRFDPELGESTVYRENTNNANGLTLGHDGLIYACEGGARRVTRPAGR